MDFLSLLCKMDLFSGFTLKDMKLLFTNDLFQINNYKKNSIIYFQLEQCVSFDIILAGQIIIQKINSNGDVLTISEFYEGDIFGGNLLFSQKNYYPMTVISKTDSTILRIKKELILKLCQENKTFLTHFLESISNKTIILTDKINTLSSKTIRECIIDFLSFENYAQNSNIIKLNMTKKELAERFGISRTSLSRELNKMRSEGLIAFDAKFINIVDNKARSK